MAELEDQLKALIERYGSAEVRKLVAKLIAPPKRSMRKTATEYVTEMSVPAVHKEKLLALARQFEDNKFLPSTADIRNLFHALGTTAGSIKARQAAIPMVFKLLASCPTDRLDKILSQGLFSGPAELGPIADAIKATGAERRSAKSQQVFGTDDHEDGVGQEISSRRKAKPHR